MPATTVQNMISSRGNKVPNQFIILEDNRRIFQSYDSVIAIIENDGNLGKVTLDAKYWDYSVTTSKYRNLFLSETTKETQDKINSGEYKLANLN